MRHAPVLALSLYGRGRNHLARTKSQIGDQLYLNSDRFRRTVWLSTMSTEVTLFSSDMVGSPVNVEEIFYRLGIEISAIVEFDPFPQRER